MRALITLGGLVVAVAAMSGCPGGTVAEVDRNADAKQFTLTITANAISGGRNAATADWITGWVIPHYIAQQKAAGRTAHVKFQPSGVGEEDYRSEISADLKDHAGADIYAIDDVWLGEFADAGYVRPLADLAGAGRVAGWAGWAQMPAPVRDSFVYHGSRYGIPTTADGQVIFYNKRLFAKVGLPVPWQPRDWNGILAAAQKLHGRLAGVTPIQLNAGTAMGEATMQAVLPLLEGTGQRLCLDGTWQGDTQAMRDVLGLYHRIYRGGLGDPALARDPQGRERSFQEFAAGKIGILFEGDWFWRDVIAPGSGVAAMPDRDATVGYALIPAQTPGSGIRNQDFVSLSTSWGDVINPDTRYPLRAWELLELMNSADAVAAALSGAGAGAASGAGALPTVGAPSRGGWVTPRRDVNDRMLAGDPMLSFVARRVLPLTGYRPVLAAYPQVSLALRQATLNVVDGMLPAEATAEYQSRLEATIGADQVLSN